MKKKVKGEAGAASVYISRNQALKKLQVSLPDFRRLCILKGIYPRVPSNFKHLSKTSTYYYKKDIQFLMHEPLLDKFREFKSFSKKIQKALGKGDKHGAEKLEDRKPEYTVDHLVKERYPTFVDALRDLDDALCMIYLFRIMPRTTKVKSQFVTDCERIAREFMAYVIKTNSLRKCFLSIKGIYYQADIMGQTVTWIAPYEFNQNVPDDVDFRVMLTFLEFYTTTMGFVNCRLYHAENFTYPPKIDVDVESSTRSLKAFRMEERTNTDGIQVDLNMNKNGSSSDNSHDNDKAISDETIEKQKEESSQRIKTLSAAFDRLPNNNNLAEAAAAAENENNASNISSGSDDDTESKVTDNNSSSSVEVKSAVLDIFKPEIAGSDNLDLDKSVENEQDSFSSLFDKCVVYLNREVPKESLEFIIQSCGGEVLFDGLGESKQDVIKDTSITHHIIDRPITKNMLFPNRVYVQPQWVYDCVNAKTVLPFEPYMEGKELPPHLSPFVKNEEGDYVPIDPLATMVNGGNDSAQQVQDKQDQQDDASNSDDDNDDLHEKELKAERSGKSYSEMQDGDEETGSEKKKKTKGGSKKNKRNAAQQGSQEDEEKELAKIMMTKKHKKLYDKIMYAKGQKEEKVKKLSRKRQKLDAQK